ncbi:hypothetical protein N5O88_05560 [Pseudomonas sp. GD03721]|nr:MULTISPECIES: hypothetical protein [unclassified Pseudomonas]MDH1442072.1 hypothetical protein [Pseudomonas sp. GD03722]WGG02712.1 hypothetical protein N5O88_05560 [Pseudomonas sp. GD03721]WGG06880.1 hypothetical protein N5O87_05570 [Pseudomonas sp. GD03919]
MFYSPSTNAFYTSAIHAGRMPSDAIEITSALHAALMSGQSEGKQIVCDAEGQPALIDPPAPEPTPEDIERALTAVLNHHLDAVAGERRYDSRFTCSLRAGFPGPFQEEGQVFAAWMDACNMAAYQLMAEVKAGSRKVPTEAELIAAMPVIEWPPSPIPAGAA